MRLFSDLMKPSKQRSIKGVKAYQFYFSRHFFLFILLSFCCDEKKNKRRHFSNEPKLITNSKVYLLMKIKFWVKIQTNFHILQMPSKYVQIYVVINSVTSKLANVNKWKIKTKHKLSGKTVVSFPVEEEFAHV